MVSLKGLYHCPSSQYSWAKDLGFNLIEVRAESLNFMLPKIQEAINSLHALRMSAMIDLYSAYDLNTTHEYLKELELEDSDIIYLMDEPNLKNLPPAYIRGLHDAAKSIKPRNRTMIVLSWIRPYEIGGNTYVNCADIIGLDFYKKYWNDPWGALKLMWRSKRLRRHHLGPIVGVPAIRYSASFVKQQAWFWKCIIKVDGLCFYSGTPCEEKPPWGSKYLWEMLDTCKILKEINE